MMRRAVIAAAVLAAAGAGQAQSVAAVRTAAGGLDVDTANVVTVMPESLWTNCVLWMPFSKEQTAGTYYDYSSKQNDGAQTDANARPLWTNANGGHYRFDGTSDFISLGTAPSYANDSEGTFACWLFFTTNPAIIYTKQGDSAYPGGYINTLEFFVENDKVHFRVFSGGTVAFLALTTSTLPLGAWSHIAVAVSTAGGNAFYIDGAKQSVSYVTGDASSHIWFSDCYSASRKHAIGAYIVYTDIVELYGKAGIDDFRIYNRALSAAEIGLLYTNTSRGKL